MQNNDNSNNKQTVFLYERIKKLRLNKNKTQEEIANALGCSLGTYRRYEKGQQKVKTKIIIKLAKYYGTSIDYILELTDEIAPYENNHDNQD